MRARSVAFSALVALLATGCGAGRGIRTEPSETPLDQLVSGSPGTAVRVLSAIVVLGLPVSLVSTGDAVMVSTFASPGVQLLDSRTGRRGAMIDTPTRAGVSPSIAATPGVLWVLIRPEEGGSRLLRVPVGRPTGSMSLFSAGMGFASRLYPRDLFSYPRMTRLVGATRSALWLVSRSASGYTLWRRDLGTAQVRRFPLASVGSPGLAISDERVYVLLQTVAPRGVVLQTRSPEGDVVATSPTTHMQGTFEPVPLAACGGSVFGWTRNSQGAALFDMPGGGSGEPRYSHRMPPFGPPSKLTAIAPAPGCRSIWVSTVSGASAVISRLRASTLTVASQLETAYIRALLWTHGALWAADLEHQAVLRMR
jgi:hypothetical protein